MGDLREHRVSGEVVFEGRVVGVRVDTASLPGGAIARREVVEHPPSVVVVPIDSNGDMVMVRQFRYPVGETLVEAPAGSVEDGELPEQSAQRELQEEIGYRAESLERLGSFWMSPGYCTELMHAFVARGLSPSALDPDDDENIEVVRRPLSEARALIERGEVRDAKTIAALLMLASAAQPGSPSLPRARPAPERARSHRVQCRRP